MENSSKISEKFTSTLKETKGGVPQHSVLGPVLFLLYVNDLPINIQTGRTTLFADDTNVQIEATNVWIEDTNVQIKATNVQIEATNANILSEKIKEVMQQLSSWFYLNKLVINTDKTIAV